MELPAGSSQLGKLPNVGFWLNVDPPLIPDKFHVDNTRGLVKRSSYELHRHPSGLPHRTNLIILQNIRYKLTLGSVDSKPHNPDEVPGSEWD